MTSHLTNGALGPEKVQTSRQAKRVRGGAACKEVGVGTGGWHSV